MGKQHLSGSRGCIDLGIRLEATVDTVIKSHRRRRHRVATLNDIEDHIQSIKERGLLEGEDIKLWKREDKYKSVFNSKETWKMIRGPQPKVNWYAGIWFAFHTPKYSFMAWLAIRNRFATGDRVQQWNTNHPSSCVFCNVPVESRNHLFFACSFSRRVWKDLAQKLMQMSYTHQWDQIIQLLHDKNRDATDLFLLRYVFQATLYAIWRERNQRKHGENPRTPDQLIQMVDKIVRNRLSSIRDKAHSGGLTKWFATR
ncbi:uncharacterized protein LOC125594991 [Brassica napus]|uniref:uncharacterized protein LOC106421062 n=1 Tax=Brassica napus TaxID=3708 RepID=UPI0006AB425B|nr:uncharacterized protein LOC106421062 [Brassica napus]XP_048626938.1 uncharacterized protein LOC125594991 [Brassica napus]